MSEDSKTKESVYSNTNGFPLAEGKTLHMDLSMGQISNRIITVGGYGRAVKIAKLFDNGQYSEIVSSRGFNTYNGTYNGVAVSVVAIGMGISMMDFFVRETRAVIEPGQKMIAVRFGTCGGLDVDCTAGTIVVAEGSALVTRNPDHFSNLYEGKEFNSSSSSTAYTKSRVAPADHALTTLITEELTKESFLQGKIHTGINVSADSFYGSQGRIDDNFHDDNVSFINEVISHYNGQAKSMEMESFQLLHLAHCSKSTCPIIAAAAAIVVANRCSSDVIDGESLDKMEFEGGRALLEAITKIN